MKDTNEEVFTRALEVWGGQAQMDKGTEECAELIAELARYQNGGGSYDRICEEIADVLIMARQLRLLFGRDVVDNHEQEKIDRLEQRLSEAEADA